MSPMAPFLTVLRRFGALAAVAGLLSQSVLPAAHSWSVGASETAYHASVHDAAPQANLCDAHRSDHHHHSDADCRLCPLFSSARLAALHGAGAAPAPAVVAALLGAASGLVFSADVPGAPLRGPPAVLS